MSFKIMPLGDSISYGVVNSQVGDTESGGYRTELWNLFGADNFSADMVGSVSSGPTNIDRNHEGHRGWRIDEISSSVDGWLTTYQPDAVMLMIGTNDILQNYDVNNADDRLDALVDKITSKVPNARLFLGSIPPSFKYADDLAQVNAFNTQVLQIVNNNVSQGKKVTFVDINSKLNENDLADKIHPTIGGYTKIANAWYDALLPFTDIKKTTRIQAEDMTLTNYSVESGNSSALARKVISLGNTPNGTASFQFSGTSGKYDVVLGYYDENDGQAQLKVKIGGNQVDQWTLNQNLGSGSANSQTKTRRTVATSFTLNQGTTIEIQGTANQAEYARVDYVELIPNETSSTASLSAANITEGDGTTHTFSVTYMDDDGVNLSTLDGNDIRVTGANSFNQLAYLIGVNQSGADVTGFYRINAPGGSWDTADNGTYSVALQNGQVKDTQNNAFPSGNLGTFQVNVPPPLGNIRIEAENMQRTTYLVESNTAASNGQLISLAQSGGSSGTATTTFNGASGIYDVVVRYFDENDGQTTLTAKIGGTQIAQWTFNQNLGSSGANSQTAVIKTIATGLSINQGTTIQLQGLANQGEFARVDYIEFLSAGAALAISPADVTAPTASLSASNITQGNGTTQTLTVTYSDNEGVDVSSLDGNDLGVTGPNGFNQLATLVSVDTNTNGTPRTATYSINAPGGTWDTLDNGSYTVALQNGQVKDTSSNFVQSGNLGTFQVNVPQPAVNIRMEAENMQLTTYLVESNSVGSGSKVIGLPKTGGTNGTATTTFTGASGTYDVLLRYFDENDGKAILTTSIGGIQVDGRTLDQNLGSGAVNSQTAVTKTIATGLSIDQGTTIQIQGVANQAEYARVDYIEFVPVNVSTIDGTEFADTLTGNSQNNIINGFGGDDILIGGAGNDSLNGGGGADLFVLAAGEGSDVITDFAGGQDRLGLGGGLTFEQLAIAQGTGANLYNTVIAIANSDQLIATLTGIQASTITATDFTAV